MQDTFDFGMFVFTVGTAGLLNYRAMLCISAAYAVMRCLSVSPFVCLSVMFVDHVKTNKHILEIFSPLGSHTILVFFAPNGVAIFRREPP